jgi:hypothetical protein
MRSIYELDVFLWASFSRTDFAVSNTVITKNAQVPNSVCRDLDASEKVVILDPWNQSV